jgi:hypothetical protein
MMPYVQGDPKSVPDIYAPYKEVVEKVFVKKGDIGFLTIDESLVTEGKPHRGDRAKHGRALHTEVGKIPGKDIYAWGGWGSRHVVTLDKDVRILLANNLDDSCALWDAEHPDTSIDGDIGHVANDYPYSGAILMKAGEVHEIGVLTPHESLPVKQDYFRQFLRILSSGVYGREEYFTKNPLIPFN